MPRHEGMVHPGNIISFSFFFLAKARRARRNRETMMLGRQLVPDYIALSVWADGVASDSRGRCGAQFTGNQWTC